MYLRNTKKQDIGLNLFRKTVSAKLENLIFSHVFNFCLLECLLIQVFMYFMWIYLCVNNISNLGGYFGSPQN